MEKKEKKDVVESKKETKENKGKVNKEPELKEKEAGTKEEKNSKETEKKEKVIKEEKEPSKTEDLENKSTFKVVKPSESKVKEEPKESKKSKEKVKVTEAGKKKKGKGGKIFLVIILLIILAIVIHYVRNQLIFSKINNAAKNYTSIENYEIKREIIGTDEKNTTDAKYLNGLYKVTLTTSDNVKITLVTMQNKVAMLTEKDGAKTVRFVNKDKVILNGIIGLKNRTFTSNKWYDNCCSMIHTKKENGKEYYVISGFNSNLLPTVGANVEAYVNKKTGLIERLVETKKDGKAASITTYQYEFNNVRNTDLGISDISEYKLAE